MSGWAVLFYSFDTQTLEKQPRMPALVMTQVTPAKFLVYSYYDRITCSRVLTRVDYYYSPSGGPVFAVEGLINSLSEAYSTITVENSCDSLSPARLQSPGWVTIEVLRKG